MRVPLDQSLASRSIVKSAGKPGNGSPKPDGTRLQAVGLSPEIVLMVVIRISSENRTKADVVYITEGNSFGYALASDQNTTGV